MFLQDSILFLMGPNPASGKTVYKSCVKTFNKNFCVIRVDTPWRAVLHLGENVKPEWRALYKITLVKESRRPTMENPPWRYSCECSGLNYKPREY